MVNTKKLKEAVKKSANSLAKNAEMVKNATVGKANTKIKNSKAFKEHKHCKTCGKTISPLVEELLCNSQSCIDSAEKDLKLKKKLRFWMIVLVVVLILPTITQLIGINFN